MGVSGCVLGLHIHKAEQFCHTLTLFLPRPNTMNLESFSNNLSNTHSRVNRGIRILKNDLHLAAERTELGLLHRGHFPPSEGHRARGRFHKPEDGAAVGGLSGSRFPNEAEHFAISYGEGDLVDRFNLGAPGSKQAGPGRKPGAQVFCSEER